MFEFAFPHIDANFINIEFLVVTLLVAIASIYDIKSRRIPNWLIAIGLTSSLFYQVFSSYGYGLTFWVTGLAVGFFSFFPIYLLRAMGAGDVKLMATVGSFIGGTAAFQTVVLTLLAGGALAVLVMIWKRSWKLVVENIGLMTANMVVDAMTRQLPNADTSIKSAGNLPYGVAIAAGTLLYVFFFRP